jgi:hypothetical protein
MNLLVAVSTGAPDWLGHPIVRDKGPLRAAAIFAEDPEKVVARRLNKMAPDKALPGLHILCGEFRLTEATLDDASEKLACFDLIYGDPLIVVADIEDLNDGVQVRRALSLWRELARRTGAAVMLNHHLKKGPAGDWADAILGSMQIQASVDGFMLIERAANLEKDEARVRYEGRDWCKRRRDNVPPRRVER